MTRLTTRVAATIKRRALVAPGDRVAVAASAGADSTALAWLLRHLEIEIAGLVHVNHGLRGAESDGDESFCRALADRLGVPFDVTRVDVAAIARRERRSIEAAARDVRYACLADAAARLGATSIATGHTLDDQAETVLLRVLRGAGIRGLAGIRPKRGQVIRPLLDCRRAELRRFLSARGEAFREDRSNDDRTIPRNRIRHELLPVVAGLAPGGIDALARLADLAADDDGFLSAAATEMAATIVLEEGACDRTVRPSLLRGLPPALGRRLVMMAAAARDGLAPSAPLSARHVDAVLALAAADRSVGHLDLPGLSVDRDLDVLRFRRTDARRSAHADADPMSFEHPLPVPGSVPLPESGLMLSAMTPLEAAEDVAELAGSSTAVLQRSALAFPLTVRNRRPGDRLRPLGAPGRRKLQDVLVDRKVPRAERDSLPLVVDAGGNIVWVGGVTIAHECRVTVPGAGVVILELRAHPRPGSRLGK
jgi:tRNA(Ile)-lysidine synthase